MLTAAAPTTKDVEEEVRVVYNGERNKNESVWLFEVSSLLFINFNKRCAFGMIAKLSLMV
jgi:hypothetical protein